MKKDKQQVHDFWNEASCGEHLYLDGPLDRETYEAQAQKRYELEPYILEFADFNSAKAKRVLEIGVGLGADHQGYAQSGADLYGIDLTERAVKHTQRRLMAFDLSSQLVVGDAEQLDFPDEYFDRVYSWGVLHHSPDTSKAVAEVWRILKQGGEAKVMIYHKWSLIGLMLWLRYGLFRFRPFASLSELYGEYLESPGTKAYSVEEATELFFAFEEVTITSDNDFISAEQLI